MTKSGKQIALRSKTIVKTLVISPIYFRTHTYVSQFHLTLMLLSRAYDLPKIHKPGYPIRVIVSSTGSSLHNLATFKILRLSLPTPISHIKNSLDFIKKFSGIHIPEEYNLISLNVTSLFTNVPMDLVNDILKDK